MSSSYRKSSLACAVAVALAGSPAFAAQTYFVPNVEVSAEHHSNRDLRPEAGPQSGDTESVEGYFADLGGLFGVRGPLGYTELRPDVQFQEYPDRKDLQRTNEYLDLRSGYKTARSDWRMVGHYAREDRYRAELVSAGFDEFDPNNPTLSGTGRTTIQSETRSLVQLRPRYAYQATQRMALGVEALYETATYSGPPESTSVDYDYMQGTGFFHWNLTQRMGLTTSAFADRYEAKDDSNLTDSKGVSAEFDHHWSETLVATATVLFERTEFDRRNGTPTETSNHWGLNVGAVKTGQIDVLRFTVGRSFTPSGSGFKTQVDQINFKYDRNLTPRWTLMTAARAFRARAQGVQVGVDDRDYARGDVELRWNVSRTWYLGGGYSYIWQRYKVDPSAGKDNVFMVRVGYQGLAPQGLGRPGA